MRRLIDTVADALGGLFASLPFREEEPANEMEAYQVRIRNHKRLTYVRTAVIVTVTVLLLLAVRWLLVRLHYNSYEVKAYEEKTDSVSRFVYMGGLILRYSSDGASLINGDLEPRWDVTYDLTMPQADVCDQAAVIYDKRGTGIYVFDRKGKLGSFTSDGPVLYARVSGKGNVAAAVEENGGVMIRYYTAAGEEIASISGKTAEEGYPVSLAVSRDGTSLAVSRILADPGRIRSRLTFYNFENAGSENHVSAVYEFEDILVPQVAFVDGSTAVAFREDGFTVYKGSQPEETRNVSFGREVVSTFCGSGRFGFVFPGEDTDHRYDMEIYTSSGNLITSCHVDTMFEGIQLCDSEILFYNNNYLAIYNNRGICRFSGNLSEGDITDVTRIGMNRYYVVTDTRSETIRLKLR